MFAITRFRLLISKFFTRNFVFIEVVISKFHCTLKPFGYLQCEDSASSVSVNATQISLFGKREGRVRA